MLIYRWGSSWKHYFNNLVYRWWLGISRYRAPYDRPAKCNPHS